MTRSAQMNETVDFYFDFMSPYSYLAATRVEATLEPLGASINWRACFLPGLLKAAGNRGPGEIPAKALYALKDLNDWAEHLGLPPIVLPDRFPFFATQANRCALIAQQRGAASTFCRAMFEAIWRDRADPTEPAVIERVLTSVGLHAAEVMTLASSQELKNQLRASTDEAAARGAFGVPTFFLGEEMFVGNDRIEFVARRLASKKR